MSKQLINQYYNQLHLLRRAGVKNEMAIKQPFDMLVQQLASSKHYVYATEVTIKNETGKNIRPDGILMNELRIHKGFVESKDTDDSIDDEIEKKLYKDGYPKTNILFQDSLTAVLIQNGEEVMRVDMQNTDSLEAILKEFIEYRPAYIKAFDEALEKFKTDIPTIVETLRSVIEEQNKTNTLFKASRDAFWEMCKQEVNPEITMDDIREMVIQHVLTEDLFKSVFDESDFHHENNIARELEKLVNTFMNRTLRQNKLKELGHYYKTLNAQASAVADHHEKQKFLKVVYENFYKVYNPKGADRLGVVYTPNEIVDFMVRSADYLLEKHFGRNLHHENVHILDPATGTGTFITDIIEYIPQQYLKHKYQNEIHANELAILPYYVANLNIEFTYKQKMGAYEEFPNICFVDTLDNTASLSFEGKQHELFGLSHENAQRIKRQNEQRISVVIGNPPYNANQANFNDFNKNREYPFIDKRIKDTFVKYSTAQKTKVYDMYSRFFRWAMDRIEQNGIISFITNRSFIDSRTFDGFRNCIQNDFDYCYIIDTRSDVRANPKIAGTTHNVFGIQTGVAIMFLVRKTPKNENGCQIYYNGEIQDDWRKELKLEWIKNCHFPTIKFEHITPQKNNWINLTDNDWEELVPLCDKQVKLGKSKEAVFELFSLGIATNRDEWLYDFSKNNLETKVSFFLKDYEKSIKILQNKGVLNYEKVPIKLTSELIEHINKGPSIKFDIHRIKSASFRPFIKKHCYYEKIIIHRFYKQNQIFPLDNEWKNLSICFRGPTAEHFASFCTTLVHDLAFLKTGNGGTFSLPLFLYNSLGDCIYNITDWGLAQFQKHYSDNAIAKEDIFHYTYGVLHNPAYRKKYELNLKRDFPRLPFYKNFRKWASWGKTLMDLHIGYEEAEPYGLERQDAETKNDRKLKVKLRAEKESGTILLDEKTALTGVPPQAWQYRLGNRSALEWVLDQYKEKKPRDKTIAEKFNTYRFADYKEQVIDLLKRVATVSVKTMEIVNQMENEETHE